MPHISPFGGAAPGKANFPGHGCQCEPEGGPRGCVVCAGAAASQPPFPPLQDAQRGSGRERVHTYKAVTGGGAEEPEQAGARTRRTAWPQRNGPGTNTNPFKARHGLGGLSDWPSLQGKRGAEQHGGLRLEPSLGGLLEEEEQPLRTANTSQ